MGVVSLVARPTSARHLRLVELGVCFWASNRITSLSEMGRTPTAAPELALFARERTGSGALVEIPMFECPADRPLRTEFRCKSVYGTMCKALR